MKKVGIVIPSYNQGKYIREAIESALRNVKAMEASVVVIDGGSKDQSASIIEEYSSKFAFWCSEPDKGQANAINKGISHMKDCQYYLWLNSDDVFEADNVVKKLIDFAENSGYEVCYGKSHFINEEGEIIGEYPVEPFSYKNLGKRCYISQPSVLFSRKAYEETGPLNEELCMCLDYEYWIRLAQKYSFGYIDEYIGATRIHGDTKTATMHQKHLEEAIAILVHYYGNVPMHWVVTKILADYPKSLINCFPKRLLLVMLRPWKNKIIRQVVEGKKNVNKVISK